LTDQQQNIVAEYTYDAWGNTLSATGAQAASNTYRFSTKEFFPGSGFYNYGYRFYAPGMGRWINRDPIGESGGLNLYAFGPNSPVNGYDPYGMDWLDNSSNLASGWGDTLSLGATWYVREYFELNEVVDECGGYYFAGTVVGEVHLRLLTRGRGGPTRPWKTLTKAPQLSKKAPVKAANLPTRGKIRYIPPKTWTPNQPLPRGPRNGYLDKFNNEWTKGPSRTRGEPFEWDVQLGSKATPGMKYLSPDKSHVNVSLGGRVTH
jgi:RHS repeat-associated protein